MILSLSAAVLLDCVLGEPRSYHPLVGFGRLVDVVERALHRAQSPFGQWSSGTVAWLLLVAPFSLLAYGLSLYVGQWLDILLLYFALGHRSLGQHAMAIEQPLRAGDLAQARQRLSWIVSRDCTTLNEQQIASATCESVLENGNDAVFGALFWFVIAGGCGALVFRLANTLDARWGYLSPRYRYFGKTAARLDDLLNYLPARLTALSYLLLGNSPNAWHCWLQQAPLWDSPNAGPVMASGAGALTLQLGGPACYQGQWHQRPSLGRGAPATAADIQRARSLVSRSLGLWWLLCLCADLGLNLWPN